MSEIDDLRAECAARKDLEKRLRAKIKSLKNSLGEVFAFDDEDHFSEYSYETQDLITAITKKIMDDTLRNGH